MRKCAGTQYSGSLQRPATSGAVGWAASVLGAVAVLSGCATADTPRASAVLADTGSAEAAVGFTNPPYSGAIGPSTPPPTPVPPGQKPIAPPIQAALNVLYDAPPAPGPEPIPANPPQALYVVGKDPVIQALPGPPAFPDKIPKTLQAVMPPKVPFSNNIKRLKGGTFRMVSYDRTANDTKLSQDSMDVEISFTDAEGAQWRIEQAAIAPLSPSPVTEPWFGGVAIDVLYHGDTGQGTPAEPKLLCLHCSWGWADVYKNGTRVASSAPLHVMVSSDTRDDSNNFRYYGYDTTANPVREVHVIVAPSAALPSPGGFLHVMWENAEIRRGTPEQIAAIAPKLSEDVPTIELTAVPHLRWDKEEIRVKAGQKYRLLVHNMDPVSFHQFRLHSTPAGKGHHGGSDARHEETMTAGRIGPLWKPGDKEHHGKGDPPAPKHVFFPILEGMTWATMVEFDKPGEYEFMCPVANHYRRGMKGKFIVTAEEPSQSKRDSHSHGGKQ